MLEPIQNVHINNAKGIMHEKKLWFNKYRNADYGTVMAGREPDDIQRNYGCCSECLEQRLESTDFKHISD